MKKKQVIKEAQSILHSAWMKKDFEECVDQIGGKASGYLLITRSIDGDFSMSSKGLSRAEEVYVCEQHKNWALNQNSLDMFDENNESEEDY